MVTQDQSELLRELELVRDALDQSAIVAVTDRAGQIIHVNEKFCEISKYSREELIGQNHRIINSAYHDKSFFQEMWKTIAKGKIWEGEIKNRAKDGSFYWVNTTIVPFLDESSKPYKYVSIRYEITQRKQAEEQLRIYAEKLERSNQELESSVQTVLNREEQILRQDRLASVGLLASSLAHEIGTPLGVVRGRAEYLEMKLQDQPEVQKTTSVIIAQIDRVSKLIHALLNLARGDKTKHTETVFVKKIILDLHELLAHEMRKQQITFSMDISDSLAVKAEPGPLQQVLLNLLVNSVHAIETAKKINNFIRISAQDKASFIVLQIEDSGCGISEENRRKIFQPFFTTKDIGKGTGLGLATSYRIVESWGGKIELESQENLGTSFFLHLPKP